MYKVSHAPSSTHTRLLLPVSLYTHQAHNIRASPPPPRPIYFFLQVNLFRVLHRHQHPEPPRPLPGKYSRRKLPQLVPHHLVRNHHVVVHLAVVHLEYQSHHVGQDGRRTRLRADWRDFLAGEDFEDWETGACVRSEGAGGPGGLGEGGGYGTMCGPGLGRR